MAGINGGGMQGKVAVDGSGEYTCDNSADIWPVRLSFFRPLTPFTIKIPA
jgi:hypothetical protein